jgi:3-hydroxyacyl-[acyl-carrier-protein] dehydratase
MTPLYQISNLAIKESSFSAEITFDPSHPVFQGHFPGQPIVPGVVLVEISAAVLSLVTGKELIVKEASVIKFLRVIEPIKQLTVMINGSVIEEDHAVYKADMSFSAGEAVFAKLKGIRFI